MITYPLAGNFLYHDFNQNNSKNNMNPKTLKKIIMWSIAGILALVIIFNGISFHNNETDLRNKFTQKTTERTAFYDKMKKIVSQKSQIAVRNDESFRKNIDLIMTGRKDAEGIFMKWVTETNPNANFQEVSALYKDLSRSVEAEREGFFDQEKVLQDIKLQHDNILTKFPSALYGWVFGRKKLDYKPITSDQTDEVMKSGKDNNVNVFE